MHIYHLQVNHLTAPLGFRMLRSVFSWKVEGAKGKKQEAARIVVAKDEAMSDVVKDTGYDAGAVSLGTSLDLPLAPCTRYYWTVSVKTDAGEECTSRAAWFETSKMEEPWTGRWITCDSAISRHPVFKKEIHPAKKVRAARLYICGLGLYEAYYVPKELSPEFKSPAWEERRYKIGEEYLAPYCNDYDEWLQYQTFDVTGQLQSEGVLSIFLGNGWYKGRFGFSSREEKGFYGNEWKLIAELHILYEDGTKEVIGTDDTWEVARSNIIFSSIYDGEQIDDTLEDAPETKAVICGAPKGELTPRMSLPVTAHETFTPKELIVTPKGEQVFDLGQEFTGIFTLAVDEPKGTKIHIQTGEVLQHGNFYNENLRNARSELIYISDGTKKTIMPHFTFYGYRYVKVSGVSDLKKEDFTGYALYSDIAYGGDLVTGHGLVNKLVENVRWGMKGNFLDVPTDCPQRDERMGWTGDTQVFSPTACYLADTYAFYGKYLHDMACEQKGLKGMVPNVVPSFGMDSTACVWGDAACIIPWNLYTFYGDVSILEDQYGSMKAWVDYITEVDKDDHSWRNVFHFGDWLALDNPDPTVDAVLGGTDEGFIANIYYAVSAGIVSKAAGILGHDEDKEKYGRLSEKQFEAVRHEYYSPSGRCCVNTQTAMLLTLKYGLSDNVDLTRSMLEKLFFNAGNKLKTGFVGTPLLGNVLTENGFTELAFKLLQNEDYPGWLHEIKLGATTVWERWNSLDEDGLISSTGMNSLNHYSYGSILEWMFRHVVGIDQKEGERGYKHAVLHPNLNWGLRKAAGEYDSPAGKYGVSWELTDPTHVTIHVKVPFDCCADMVFPESDKAPLTLEAGEYEFSYGLSRSMKKTYDLDTPVFEIFEDPKAVEALKDLITYEEIPAQFRRCSLLQVNKELGGKMGQQTLGMIETRLKDL